MIRLTVSLIHLLDHLLFRFQEDYRLDGRLIEDFLHAQTSIEAVTSVLESLETTLSAKQILYWNVSDAGSCDLVARSWSDDSHRPTLPAAMVLAIEDRWIRFEPLSADWPQTMNALFGASDSDIGAIDVIRRQRNILLIAWQTAPKTAPAFEAPLALLKSAMDIDLLPPSLMRHVSSPTGRSYHLASLMALHRMHDEAGAALQDKAMQWLDILKPSCPDLDRNVEALIRLQRLGYVLAPQSILHKHKPSKDEANLLDEFLEGAEDLAKLFHLPEELCFLEPRFDSGKTRLSREKSLFLACWHLASLNPHGQHPKIPHSLAKRYDATVHQCLKTKKLC